MNENKLIHQRDIKINCYETAQGTLMIEGILSDERMFPFLLYSSKKRCDAGFVHKIVVTMTLSIPDLEIINIESQMPVVPLPECTEIRDSVKRLLGKRIAGGFTNEVKKMLGRTQGCLHMTNLILAMASAAVQGAWSYYSRIREGGESKKPSTDNSIIVNSCWLWRDDGPLMERLRQTQHVDTFTVTIDGPAGAGKSTLSKELAKKLGFLYLDTGALYRALALKILRSGLDIKDEKKVEALCNATKIDFKGNVAGATISLDGEDVTEFIREERIGLTASTISTLSSVRTALLGLQRQLGQQGNIVAEGRDMGSVVFPQAQVKIFLSASPEQRAKRRHLEVIAKGGKEDFTHISSDMKKRDEQDANRGIAPLQVPIDAIFIDNSTMSVEEVVENIVEIVGSCLQKDSATH